MKLQMLALAAAATIILFSGCSSDDEPDPNNPNNPNDPGNNSGDKVTITGTSPEFTFWGDELTITGTGFSEVKDENVVTFVNSYPQAYGLKLTSKDGDIEIVSASKTKLVIRVPYIKDETPEVTHTRGEEYAKIEVTVKNTKDTSDVVKFLGLPRVGNFEYHYGWYDIGGVTRSGDSVILNGGFYGLKTGAGEAYHKQAGTYDKLRLRVDDIEVPIKYRKISNSIQGWALYLPSDKFSVVRCDEGSEGDRDMLFEFYVLGTDKKSSRLLSVTYLPSDEIKTVTGPMVVSKSAGGNPFWTVTGKDMYYHNARFVPKTCSGESTEIQVAAPGTINQEFTVGIPLSFLEEGCTYSIILVTPCDDFQQIGTVAIEP